ncbi:ATP-dependent nuclease [Lachnospiraceae bacterium YH-ros2226]
MRKLIIEKLKGIKYLEFTLPEKNGVYMLAGANGAGKTTILTCINRIGDSMAFANAFRNTGTWNKADQYRSARIIYELDGQSVLFKKESKRWAATPRKGSRLLGNFGYSSSVFISADSKRIDIKADDIRPGNTTQVEQEICNAMNLLFDTDKYTQLKRLRNTNGRGKHPTYFYLLKDSQYYYSEKRFSTGELALVRLCEKLYRAQPDTMILLDEAELALHPRVQVNLLDYLKKQADEKNLTIFISSHSPAMIKGIDKNCLYLLEDCGNGNMKVVNPCYPALALGEVDIEKSNTFDYVIFVEDDIAREILRHMLNRYINIEPQNASAQCYVVPVGGFEQTARLMANTKDRLLAQSKVFALVDADAFDDIDSKPKFKDLHDRFPQYVRSLGFTPENWLVDTFEHAENAFRDKIREIFHLEQKDVLLSKEYQNCNSSKPRQLAKDKFSVIVDMLSSAYGSSFEVTRDRFIEMAVNNLADGQIKSILNPVFTMK